MQEEIRKEIEKIRDISKERRIKQFARAEFNSVYIDADRLLKQDKDIPFQEERIVALMERFDNAEYLFHKVLLSFKVDQIVSARHEKHYNESFMVRTKDFLDRVKGISRVPKDEFMEKVGAYINEAEKYLGEQEVYGEKIYYRVLQIKEFFS